jgi:hypothetical protein
MRKSLSAFVLSLALCCPAFAGDMLTPPVPDPPPPTSSTVEGPPSDSQVPPSPPVTEVSLVKVAVTLFTNVLALL